MKILFVFGGKQKGGAERAITNIANAMIKENDVYFLGLKNINKFYEYSDKIKYYTMEKESEYKKNFLLRNYIRVKRMRKFVKEINPDVVISFAREQSYRLLLLNFFNKRRIIVSVRNDPKHEYVKFSEKITMKILYSRVNGFVFQTEEARDFFSDKIKNKSIIIPNPINELFLSTNKNVKRKKKIVAVGRLVEQKNHDLLIDAFAKISKKYNDYYVEIYGSGELKSVLEEKINKLGLSKKIFLKGEVSNVKECIEDATLFILPSNYEGMPNSLIEAMSLGLPCIATDCPCGGARFLIKNNENGIIVPTNDVEKLSKAMEKMLDNKEFCEKLGMNAKKIREVLDANKINKMWLDFIKSIV